MKYGAKAPLSPCFPVVDMKRCLCVGFDEKEAWRGRMRTFVMSDIHGCYREYQRLLQVIRFREEDTLYVLGDCVDKGDAPMELLKDMMSRPNVIPLMGNHDLEALVILRRLNEAQAGGAEQDAAFTESVRDWLADGGRTTLDGFLELSPGEQQNILAYLGTFLPYLETEIGGKRYLLVHGGLEPFVPEQRIEDYDILSLVLSRPDYEKRYFQDRVIITGHTPTPTVQKGNQGTVIRKNNHLAIDCGCVYGYRLAAVCLETGREYYVYCHRAAK